MQYIWPILNKKKHTNERSAIEIHERENFQDIYQGRSIGGGGIAHTTHSRALCIEKKIVLNLHIKN